MNKLRGKEVSAKKWKEKELIKKKWSVFKGLEWERIKWEGMKCVPRNHIKGNEMRRNEVSAKEWKECPSHDYSFGSVHE